jgi:hypothetical protein
MYASKIVRVARFGGQRTRTPPAWGILERNGDNTSDVTIFHGCKKTWFGHWFLDVGDPSSFWGVPDDAVPDEVWAALAKWRLTC